MRNTLTIRMVLLAATLALNSCASNPVTGEANFVTLSESQEIQIGRAEDAKVREQYGVYNNPELQRYVNDIGQRLAKVSHRPQLQYQFLVLDSPEVNAFALPGGYIYITRGILSYLNTEAELAAVLGHEIGHVTARHSVQQHGAATAASVGAAILQIFVPQMRNQAGDLIINVAGGALLSGYGREHELEADRLGAEYLARSGYDPQAMVRVVGVLKNQELFDAEVAKTEGRPPRRYHGLFASHPDNDTRLREVINEATRFKSEAGAPPVEDFLRKIDRMVYADSPEQGVVRNNAFYHAALGIAIQFPHGWRVKNQPRSVVALSPGEDALIDMRLAGAAQGTPADVLRKTLRLGSGAEVTPANIGNLPSAIATLSMSGKPTRVAVVFLGKNAYAIGAQARTPQAFREHQDTLNAALQSFHALTQQERGFAHPLTLRVVTARAGATFAGLARNSPLGRHAEGHLRVLNGLYPSGEPAAGQPLKIVE